MSYLARPLLFLFEAERAHTLGLAAARLLGRFPTLLDATFGRDDPRLRTRCFGLDFKNPIGLAAGLDKNGIAVPFWASIGFGFVEVGTVTPRLGQPGNPRPRVHRFPEERAILNAMGFPNDGATPLALRLRDARKQVKVPIGVNIGKAKTTSLEDASWDYITAMSVVWDVADYLTINISSPNTEGLRNLQAAARLQILLDDVVRENARLARIAGAQPKPLLVKIAPDLSNEELDAIGEVALRSGIAALIATNTTLTTRDVGGASFTGGLSGPPLKARALEVLRRLYRSVGRKVPIIGVGGIETGADVYERLTAGASLVQLYTALIYEGPGLVARMLDELSDILTKNKVTDLTTIIGVHA